MDKPAKKKKDEAKAEAPAKASKADKAGKPAKIGEAEAKKEKKSKDVPDFRIFNEEIAAIGFGLDDGGLHRGEAVIALGFEGAGDGGDDIIRQGHAGLS